jgi:APA family basic amino acid/polyamine antiporter
LADEKELKPRLGLLDATAINVGAIIGAGIFVVTGIVAGLAGSALVVSMALAAVTAIFTALSFAELTAWLPREGSVYEFGYRLISPMAGFLGGWMWILSNVFSGAAVSLGLGNYVAALVPGLSPSLIAATACVLFTGLNYIGIQHSAELNDILVAAKLIILGFFIAYGLLYVDASNFEPFRPLDAGVLYGAFYIFFAYGGFARVAVVAEEIRDAKRIVPRAIILSLMISTVFYVLVGIVAVGLVGASSLSGSGHPLALAMDATGSTAAVLLVSVGGVISTASVLLTSILGVSRLAFAMSRRGDLPGALSRIHPRFGSPHISVVIAGTLMTGLALLVDLTNVVAIGTFAMLFYYGVSNLSAMKLPEGDRRYPPAVPAVGAVICISFLAFVLFASPQAWVSGVAGLLIGVVYFKLIAGRRRRGAAQSTV